MTTDNKNFITGCQPGVPITYDRKTAPKQIIDQSQLWKADIRTFDNRIGLYTNVATTFYSMLDNYVPNSREWQILFNRLKVCCALQSCVIDYGKGLEVMTMPKHWLNWNKWDGDATEEEIELKKFYNSILAEHRPYFMRYVYPDKNRNYRRHRDVYEQYSRRHFGKSLSELLLNSSGEPENKVVYYYKRYSPFIETNSVMNRICHHLEDRIQLSRNESNFGWEFDVDETKLESMWELYKKWKSSGADVVGRDLYFKKLADSISINAIEIAKLALMTNRRFANHVFSDDILRLFFRKRILVPVLDKRGNIRFMNNNYRLAEFELGEIDERLS
jgi:hypothetical protein